ncbi:MAG TPA: hypothetical protein VK563_00225 [Puia sp.]|nr:hypothetical protein [Puia sp.]
MNSKQLNFFIVPEDLENIYSFFNKNNIKYIKISGPGINNMVLDSFPYRGKMSDKIYLSCDDFYPKIVMEYDNFKKSYIVDSYKSYLLEFNRGGFHPTDTKTLDRGRFYCTTSYFVSNGEVVKKNDDFKLWVDKIFRTFKKEFLMKLGDQRHILFSSKTLKWMEETGGKIDKAYLKISI